MTRSSYQFLVSRLILNWQHECFADQGPTQCLINALIVHVEFQTEADIRQRDESGLSKAGDFDFRARARYRTDEV